MISIINDIHLGVQRQAGTTPASQRALRELTFQRFAQLLEQCGEGQVLVAGDLFDDFVVATEDLLETYRIATGWLEANPDRSLVLVAGNHDHSPRESKVSSFTLLAEILKGTGRVQCVGVDEYIIDRKEGYVALAHCSNQDVFNTKLDECLSQVSQGWHIFLHANLNNNFAVEKDHSLNVSLAQAFEFKKKGCKVVFAHEHQARTAQDGNVVVMGNQFPTSVSDCSGNDQKFFHRLDNGKLVREVFWEADRDFVELDWQDLAHCPQVNFVRVRGAAKASQASDVINAVASLRRSSQALVITNAVKIEGVAEIEDLPANFEAARSFDVMEFIASQLDSEEMKLLQNLKEKL